MTFASDIPLVSATKLNAPPLDVGDGSNDYGTVNAAASGSWILGSSIAGRKLLVTVNVGAFTGSPTGLKVGLYSSAADTGGSPSLVTGTDTAFTTTLAAATVYRVEIDCSVVDRAKYYSLGLSVNGGGSTAIVCGATAVVLDPTYVS